MGSTAQDVAKWRTGEVIDGRYRVLGELGRGGMGVVHRVRHLGWGIDLAVKSPLPELVPSAEERQQFVAEAEAWASLGLHPHVCGCLYVRTLDGMPRAFAEYVAGGSLAGWIARRRLYAGRRAVVRARLVDLAIQIAWGLEHAHSRGLVHQDVKPANVLLAESADGALTAKVTDFGMARARSLPAAGVARPGPAGASVPVSVAGMTMAYASPEQMRGDRLGRRTDVYSYGVLLLEMFTGRVTWATGPDARAALGRRVARPALGRRPDLPDEVAKVVRRCLRADPAKRPGSMAEVATELIACFRRLVGRPYPRRRPVAADLRAGELNNRGLSLLDLGRPEEAARAFSEALAVDPRHLEAGYNDGLRRWRSGLLTDEELIGGLEEVRAAAGDPWQARYLLAEVQLERGDLAAARELLGTVEGVARREPEVGAALRTAHSGELADACCVAEREVGWHEYRRWLRLRDGGQGPVQAPIMRIRCSTDGRRALAVSRENVGVWDLREGRVLVRLAREDEEAEVLRDARLVAALNGDGRLVLCGEGTEVWLRNLAEGRELWRRVPGRGRFGRGVAARSVVAVELSADARCAVVAVREEREPRGRRGERARCGEREVRWSWLVLDGRTGRLRRRIGGREPAEAWRLSPDGRFLLTVSRPEATARLWDVSTGSCVRELTGQDRRVTAVAVSGDGRRAALARSWEDILVWDFDTGRPLRRLRGHGRLVESLAFDGDGRLLLSGGTDGTVRLWEPDSGRCLRTFRVDERGGRAVAFEAGSGRVVAAGEERVRWWTRPGRYTAPPRLSRPHGYEQLRSRGARVAGLLRRAEQAGDARRALELLAEARAVPGYERDPRLLAAWRGLGRGVARVGLRAAWPSGVFEAGSAQLTLALSEDGRIAVSGGVGGRVVVWDAERGVRLRDSGRQRTGSGIEGVVGDVAVTVGEEGPRVLYGFGGTVTAWSVETGERRVVLGYPDGLGPAGYSPDGRLVLLGGHEAMRVWDLDTGACVHTLPPHRTGPGPRVSAVWLGSGVAASAGPDTVVRLWEPATGRCVHTLRGHTQPVGSVCLSPDGRRVLSAGGYDDHTIRLWEVASGACLRVFRAESAAPGVRGAAGTVRCRAVRFSPDGRFAISGGEDGAVRVWELATGRCLSVLVGHRDAVYAVVFGPEARFALSASVDGTVRRWELDWELAPAPVC